MEDFKNNGFSSEGRKLRPRRQRISSESGDYSKRNDYQGAQRSFSSSEYSRPSESERRGAGRVERRSYNSNGSSERRSYNSNGRSYGSNNYSGTSNRGYGNNRGYQQNSRRNSEGYSGEQRPYDGESRSYGNQGRRPYNSNHRNSNRNDQRGYERRGEGYRQEGGYGQRSNFGHRSNGRPNSRFNNNGRFNNRRNDFYKFNEDPNSGIQQMIDRRPRISNMEYSDNDYVPTPIKEEVRLNKYIANSGVCSRREADQLIQAGVVTVNGEVVTELGVKVNVFKDDIRFNGEKLKGEEKVYLIMNKPKGYVTTASDPNAEKTVMDLLTNCKYRVFPVGRLDKNTTGVLMFTNDGDIAEKLTHPSYDKKKIYQVILNRPLNQEDFDKIIAGITLGDGEIKADDLEFIDAQDQRKLGIEIHSGKNRIVRRIFESLGYEVKALDRVYFAGLTKKGLKKGEWRQLTEGEANLLKMGAYI